MDENNNALVKYAAVGAGVLALAGLLGWKRKTISSFVKERIDNWNYGIRRTVEDVRLKFRKTDGVSVPKESVN